MHTAPLRASSITRITRLPRTLHPGAWWLWALGLAVIATRTTNLIIFGLLVGAATVVVLARRSDTPWALSYRLYATVAAMIVVLRVLFRVVFAAGGGGRVLLHLPQLRIFGSFTLFGPITVETLVGGLQTGAQLGVMVLCVGAANALASPKRLLAAAPGTMHEFGTVAVVTVSAFPQLAESVRRVNRARRLRDGKAGARHALRQVVLPVLADALDRSLGLAGAMDARGYGQRATLPDRVRWAANGLLLVALVALGFGLYGLIGGIGAAGWVLLVGVGAAVASLSLAGRRTTATRYRPDAWQVDEWLVVLSGLLPAGLLVWLSIAETRVLYPGAGQAQPLSLWFVALLLAVAPVLLTPRAPHAGGER